MDKISKSICKKSLVKDGVYLPVKTPTKELSENLLSLKQTTEAHAYVDMGHKKGNVVITLD